MSGSTLEGRLQSRSKSRLLRLLMALTGLLLVVAVARLVSGWILGYKRPCSVTLDEAGMAVDVKTVLAGRMLSTRKLDVPPWKVGTIEREERFRHAHVLVGAMFFLMGAGAGFGLVVEWAFTQFGIYLLMGIGAMVLGIGLDLAVVLVVPSVRRTSAVVIHTDTGTLRVDDVLDGNAERFLEHAREWFVSQRQAVSRQG